MKKGFTLAELLGVLIILALVALITFPIVDRYIKSSREQLYINQLGQIELAAESWAYKNIDLLPTNEGETITVTILTLKESGDLPLDMRDPRNDELMPNDMVVTIEFADNTYTFTVDEESGSNVTDEVNENSPIIILTGSHIDFVEINSTYNEQGAKAKDKNGNMLSDINITYRRNGIEVPQVDTSEFTTYTAIYSVTSNGNTSYITRTIIIRDTTAPDLVIPDNIDLTASQLSSFDVMEGVSATDNSGETIDVTVSGFDTSISDKIVEYTACDSRNNCVTKRRLIKIAG